MTDQPLSLAVKPIITYPHEAQVGKTYLMTIDLQPEEGFEWQYDEEDYSIYCTVNSELFSSRAIGEPVVVLHRFGGSYGKAKFLLTATQEEKEGTIIVSFVNQWGVLIKNLKLERLSVKAVANLELLPDVYQAITTRNYEDLELVFTQIEHETNLNEQELQILIAAAKSGQITIATGESAVAIGGTAGSAVVVAGDRNFTISGANAEAIGVMVNQSTLVRSRNEYLLLQAVKQEVILRLDQSLHNAVFINLGKQPQPQQVKRPWDAEIKIGAKSPEPLPAETTILEVFDRSDIAGKLLILGEPGAGKTTTMLDLAKALCDRAEQDATAFIPVLLNLSSWKDPKQTMTAWLVEELKSKYGVRKDIGTKWLAEKQLLPLLDGLDEVHPAHLESCVEAINRWLASEDSPPSLAVCCRREEYETVVRGRWQGNVEELPDNTRMHLNGAILLQTLTNEQIQTYLTATNQLQLWQTLRQDEALWELIKTPLWLSIILLSYQGLSLNQWQQAASTQQHLKLLMDAYVERMLHKPVWSRVYSKNSSPTTRQTRHWLSYLAKTLQQKSMTEFIVEQLSMSDRLQLYRKGYIPWNYSRFLDYATELLILQRIGRRYRFIHKLLQEHFAAMSLPEPQEKPD